MTFPTDHPLAGLEGVPLRLGSGIKRAEQVLIARKNRALRELDLTVPQYAVLMYLSEKPVMSGAQLARAASVTPQTMATTLANLDVKGLVVREPSEVHGKVLLTRLTRSGRALAKKADKLAVEVESRLWDAFDDAERELFRSFLDRAATVLGD